MGLQTILGLVSNLEAGLKLFNVARLESSMNFLDVLIVFDARDDPPPMWSMFRD